MGKLGLFFFLAQILVCVLSRETQPAIIVQVFGKGRNPSYAYPLYGKYVNTNSQTQFYRDPKLEIQENYEYVLGDVADQYNPYIYENPKLKTQEIDENEFAGVADEHKNVAEANQVLCAFVNSKPVFRSANLKTRENYKNGFVNLLYKHKHRKHKHTKLKTYEHEHLFGNVPHKYKHHKHKHTKLKTHEHEYSFGDVPQKHKNHKHKDPKLKTQETDENKFVDVGDEYKNVAEADQVLCTFVNSKPNFRRANLKTYEYDKNEFGNVPHKHKHRKHKRAKLKTYQYEYSLGDVPQKHKHRKHKHTKLKTYEHEYSLLVVPQKHKHYKHTGAKLKTHEGDKNEFAHDEYEPKNVALVNQQLGTFVNFKPVFRRAKLKTHEDDKNEFGNVPHKHNHAKKKIRRGKKDIHLTHLPNDENTHNKQVTERSNRRNRSLYKYMSYDEMVHIMKLASKVENPETKEPLAVLENIGHTYEGRTMYLVKISSNHSAEKSVIFFEAGMHGREWTASATAIYMINQLTQNYNAVRKILMDIDFYIIPLSNPDGYEYSRTKDRLWRKTRSFRKGHFGVDGNRNFDVHWSEALEETNDQLPSEIYKGPFPFSEVESRNIRDAGKKYKKRIKAFVSIHAFGPIIGYGWGYTSRLSAPKEQQMKMVAKAAAKAIKRYSGTEYFTGVISKILYPAAGGSDDYFKESLKIDLSFVIELSSAGRQSFEVPVSKVPAIMREAFEGLKTIAAYAATYDTEKGCFTHPETSVKELIC